MSRILLRGCNLDIEGDKVRVTADVSGFQAIWFELDSKYEWMVDTESVDAFFVLYTWVAMEVGMSLVVEGPVSEQLSTSVVGEVKSMFLTLCPRLKDVAIKVLNPVSSWASEGEVAATGFSGGVDSWYTALAAAENNSPYDYYIFANTGQHGIYDVNEVFSQRAVLAGEALSTMARPLIVVNSNIDEVLRERFQQRDVIGNISCVLLLQAAISRYAYSSSYSPEESGIIEYYDMAIMDPFILPALNTERVVFESIGIGATRIEKLRYIVGKPGFSNKIYVCIEKDLPIRNCGLCFKCRRTQLALESIHLQALIAESFDYQLYQKKRAALLVGLYASAKKDSLDLEVVDELNKRYGLKVLPYRLLASIWCAARKYLPAGVKWRIEAKAPYLF